MAINKATLAKEINGVIEYIYPKTTADMVEYDLSYSVAEKIDIMANDITGVNNRVTTLAVGVGAGTISSQNDAELIDIRNPNAGVVGADTTYNSAGDAVRGQVGKLSDEIAATDKRISSLAVGIADGEISTPFEMEIVDMRSPNTSIVGTDVEYTNAGDAIRGQVGALDEKIKKINVGVNKITDTAPTLGMDSNASGLDSIAIGNCATASAVQSIAIGSQSNSTQNRAIAIGAYSNALGISSIATGYNAVAQNDAAIAIGTDVNVSDFSSGMGYDVNALGPYNVALGENINVGVNSNRSIAIGLNIAMPNATNSIVLGGNTNIDYLDSKGKNKNGNIIAIGVSHNISANNSICIGSRCITNGSAGQIAIGRNSEALSSSVAIGTFNYAPKKSIAIGTNTGYNTEFNVSDLIMVGNNIENDCNNAISIGQDTNVKYADHSITLGSNISLGANSTIDGSEGTNSISIGNNIPCASIGSIAIGNNVLAGTNSVSLGNEASSATSSIAIGYYTRALLDSSVTIGNRAKIDSIHSIAIGAMTNVGSNANAAIAIGVSARISNGAANSIAIGQGATVNHAYCMAIGYGAQTNASYSMAVGHHALAKGNNATAVGYGVQVNSAYSVALGHTIAIANNAKSVTMVGSRINAKSNALGLIAMGSDLSFNGEECENSTMIGNTLICSNVKYSVAIGNEIELKSHNSILIGYCATSNSGNTGAISIGAYSNVNAAGAVAIGHSAESNGIAIGLYSRAINAGSIAIGAVSSGANSIAIGSAASTIDNDAISIGSNTSAGDECIAMGKNAKANTGSAIAIGAGAKAEFTSIAIGCGTNAAGTYSTALGFWATVPASDINTMQLGDNTGLSTLSCRVALSVTSDERDKTDITEIDNGAVEFLNKIKAIRYVFNSRELYIDNENLSDEEKEKKDKYGMCAYDKEAHAQGTKKGTRIRVGVSAQNTQKALREVYGDSSYANIVNDNLFDCDPDTIPEGVENKLSISYESFIPFLIKAVQELDARVVELETELKSIKASK